MDPRSVMGPWYLGEPRACVGGVESHEHVELEKKRQGCGDYSCHEPSVPLSVIYLWYYGVPRAFGVREYYKPLVLRSATTLWC